MTPSAFHELASVVSGRMINGMAAGIVVAFFAWALLRIAGRQNSSTRFAVWFAALLAIAILPFTGRLAPQSMHVVAAQPSSFTISLPASWAVRLLWGWAVIALAGLLRLMTGLIRLGQIRKHAVPLESPALDPALLETLQTFRSRRKVALCVSDQQRVPAAIGFFRPLIVFPSWTVRELSTAELNSILIHELAHLRRWDDWTNLVQKVLRTLLFFHPAVWWVENRLSLEREMACDDAVLSRTSNARAYAECLVSMAEKTFLQRTLALTQAAVGRMRQTSRRVAQILDGHCPGAVRVSRTAVALMATLVVICGITQSRAPELIAFQNSEPPLPAFSASLSHQPAVQMASFKTHALESVPKVSGTSHVAKLARERKPARPVREPGAIEAKLNPPAPAIGNVKLTANPRVAQSMLVVFQQRNYGRFQQVQWTVLVWRVSLQHSVETQLPPKKT